MTIAPDSSEPASAGASAASAGASPARPPPAGDSEPHAAASVGATAASAGPPPAKPVPPGDSESHAAGSVGATATSAGPPQARPAPSGGSEPHAVGSVGAYKPSLRSRVARHVMLPLVLMWALGTAVALSVANYFAGQAFDRALLDDAYAVAANVRSGPAGPVLSLSPREMGALLFDQSEAVYFAVLLPGGELVAGHAGLRAAALSEGLPYAFSDMSFQGRELRSVSLRRSEPAPFTVVMAQTSASRNQLLHRMLGYAVVPQVLLLLLLAWWLLRVIQRDLQPLAELQRAVERRDARDLTPVPSSVTAGASTRDVERLGLAVNSMLARLDESISAQREFAGNVAHELRTPLAGIRAQAGYALAHADPQVWREQLLGITRGEARASHMVEQLLALALADEARTGLRLERVALNELARDVLLRFMPKADAAGVDLGGEGLDEPVSVWADAALLEGILGNLLDNALRYGNAAQPRVTVSVERQGDAAVLSVTDNGPGISEQDAGQMRNRWTLGPAGQRLGEGAGLGLAIVSRYAELLGARFSLDAAEGEPGLRASVQFGAGPVVSPAP
ncbi:MAG: integral rane sensor signal transduction histidine kinase [Polaromonas sp.]|nr:integral rane sensor signal transduction histidine kinase [Polaromonas sp.]